MEMTPNSLGKTAVLLLLLARISSIHAFPIESVAVEIKNPTGEIHQGSLEEEPALEVNGPDFEDDELEDGQEANLVDDDVARAGTEYKTAGIGEAGNEEPDQPQQTEVQAEGNENGEQLDPPYPQMGYPEPPEERPSSENQRQQSVEMNEGEEENERPETAEPGIEVELNPDLEDQGINRDIQSDIDNFIEEEEMEPNQNASIDGEIGAENQNMIQGEDEGMIPDNKLKTEEILGQNSEGDEGQMEEMGEDGEGEQVPYQMEMEM